MGVIGLLPTAASGSAKASQLPPELRDVLTRISGLPGFSCHFQQAIIFSDGTEQHYSGTLAVLPPNRFRWQYVKPYEQLIVSSGEKLWHYEPDLMQVRILDNLEEVDPVVMQLLAGQLGVKDLELLKSDADHKRYYVHIKNGPKVWLGLSADGLIASVETLDVLGNRNRIELDHWNLRAPSADKFVFHVPAGVDIVEQ
jgi:outer membrane lipoprotein carrier protein